MPHNKRLQRTAATVFSWLARGWPPQLSHDPLAGAGTPTSLAAIAE